jgi:thiamine biosynthesis lipoprotein
MNLIPSRGKAISINRQVNGVEKTNCVAKTFFCMNTVIEYRLFGAMAKIAALAVENELNRLEALLSRYRSNSDTERINRASGEKMVSVSNETFELLSYSKQLAKISDGLFSVMIGPLVDLWDYKQATKPPKGTTIKKTLHLVDNNDLLLEADNHTVGLRTIGQSLDVGGIGKGYAANRCQYILDIHGISSAFLNIGGNVVVVGNNLEGKSWRVGVQHPRKPEALLGVLEIGNTSIVTSGDYERFFVGPEGRRWHHILDPRTGYPSQSGLTSVTVVYGNSMIADALSTILFVSGLENGLEILSLFPHAEAIFVDKNLQVVLTEGLIPSFKPSAPLDMKVGKRIGKHEKHEDKEEETNALDSIGFRNGNHGYTHSVSIT